MTTDPKDEKISVTFKKKDGTTVTFKVKRRHRKRKASMTLTQIKHALDKGYVKANPGVARKLQKILRRSPTISLEKAMKRYAKMGYKTANRDAISVV